MKTVITVVGKDKVGILSSVATKCAEYGVNIEDVSQTILQGMFCMIMICEIDTGKVKFVDFADGIKEYGKNLDMKIDVMNREIFDSMHRI